MERKKEYDRKRAKRIYEEYKRKRAELIKQFGSKCWICNATEVRLEFHHLKYHEQGPYGHASMWRRIQMLKEIEKHPEDFRLLCTRGHSVVSFIMSLSKEAYDRLMSVIRATE